MIKYLNLNHYYHNCSQVQRVSLACILYIAPISLVSLPTAILHFVCFSYLLSAFLPLCDLVLLSPRTSLLSSGDRVMD